MPLTLDWSEINLLAVIVAAIAHMLTGLVWFSSRLFGNAWMQLTGKSMTLTPPGALVGFVGHLLIASVLAVIVVLANATTVLGGIAVGILVWAGFVVTLEVGELIWEKIPLQLFMLRVGNHLVALSIAAAILAVWR